MKLRILAIPIVLIGIVLYKNPGEVHLWFFGDATMPMYEIAAFFAGSGLIFGAVIVLSFKKKPNQQAPDLTDREYNESGISDEDREYIS